MKVAKSVDENGNLECSKCRQRKPVAEFPRDRVTPTGYSYQCKVCQRAMTNESYQRHKAKTLAKKAEYREANREKRRADGHTYYQRNKERFAARYNTDIGRAGSAVRTAIKQGKLPKVTTLYCVRCLQPAKHYHHQSYLESDRLCVVPVCRACHQGMNRNRLDGNTGLGVVATRCGLVRIAISSLE